LICGSRVSTINDSEYAMTTTMRLMGLMTGLLFSALSTTTLAADSAPRFDARTCAGPSYADKALVGEETGSVLLAFMVGDDGRVVAAKTVETSGSPIIDLASMRAIKRCIFKATGQNDTSLPNWEKVRFYWN
jgi:TonB family protein